MIRRKGPILAAAVIAAFALGWYRGLFGVDQVGQTPSSLPTAPETTVKGDAPPVQAEGRPNIAADEVAPSSAQPVPSAVSSGASAGRTAETSPEARDTAALGFDVVRVEPDGSAVVAGKGAANQAITLTDGSRTLGEARTDAHGNFVMTLSLPAGSYRLQLAQRDDAVSDDAAVVNVPPAGKPEQLLVMMQRPGEASQILQRPATDVVAAAATDRQALPVATTSVGAPEARIAAVPPIPAPADATRAPASTDAGVSVEAVEIEGDRLFVAGSAKTSSVIRIYLDDRPVAEARSGDGNRFIASAKADVTVGDHTIRADILDADGRVAGRVEVPFQRPDGNSMAAVSAAPAAAQDAATERSAMAAPAATTDAGVADAPEETVTQGAPRTAPAPVGTDEPRRGDTASARSALSGELQTVRQAPLQASPSRVIIRRGDTLWRISRETYGRGSRYTVIYLANGDQIRNPNRIYPGQVFRMPDGEERGSPPRG